MERLTASSSSTPRGARSTRIPCRSGRTATASTPWAEGGEWIFPAAGFGGSGLILGRRVPCLTPEVVLVNHTTGYALDEEHERDVRALGGRYGIPVPPFRRRVS